MVELKAIAPAPVGELPSTRGTSALRMLRQWAAIAEKEICRQRAEIIALSTALKKANAQAEHFERQWYLRGDEVDQLREELDAKTSQLANVAPSSQAACLSACEGIAPQVLEQCRISLDAFAQDESRAGQVCARCDELQANFRALGCCLLEDICAEAQDKLPRSQALIDASAQVDGQELDDTYPQAVLDADARIAACLSNALSAEEYAEYAFDLALVLNQPKTVAAPALAYLAICAALMRPKRQAAFRQRLYTGTSR